MCQSNRASQDYRANLDSTCSNSQRLLKILSREVTLSDCVSLKEDTGSLEVLSLQNRMKETRMWGGDSSSGYLPSRWGGWWVGQTRVITKSLLRRFLCPHFFVTWVDLSTALEASGMFLSSDSQIIYGCRDPFSLHPIKMSALQYF